MRIYLDDIKALLDQCDVCEDGLTVMCSQSRFTLDCCLHSGKAADGTDITVYVVDEYQLREPDDNSYMNLSCCADLDFKAFEMTDSTVYTTRAEMMQHCAAFMLEHNHF